MGGRKNIVGWWDRIRAAIAAFFDEWSDPSGLKTIRKQKNTAYRSSKEKDVLGVNGEKLAVKHLKKSGFKIRDKNVKFANGEIDIIAQKGDLLVFIEVKTRKTAAFGLPIEAVKKSKRRNIVSMAEYYIFQNRLENFSIRFDIISIIWSDADKPVLDHYPGAFDATET